MHRISGWKFLICEKHPLHGLRFARFYAMMDINGNNLFIPVAYSVYWDGRYAKEQFQHCEVWLTRKVKTGIQSPAIPQDENRRCRIQNEKRPQTTNQLPAAFFCFDRFPEYPRSNKRGCPGNLSRLKSQFCEHWLSTAENLYFSGINFHFAGFCPRCRGPPLLRFWLSKS